MNSIFHRVSVRKFTEKEVEQEKIEKILKAAMASPSAMNQQAWEFYVVRNKEKIQELAKTTPYAMCVKNAPLAIAICYKKETTISEYSQIDCAIATENIMLEADSLGLGSVMIGVAPIKENMDNLKRILNVPDELEAFTVLPIGYPVEEKEQQDRYDENKVHYID